MTGLRILLVFALLLSGPKYAFSENVDLGPDVNPSGSGQAAVDNINAIVENLPDIVAGLLAKLDEGGDGKLEDKARSAMTELMCIKGNLKEKFKTVEGLIEMAEKGKELPKGQGLDKKLAAAKKYWPELIRPLGGIDGVFNSGDIKPILSCLAQNEIDWVAHNAIRIGAYPIVEREGSRYKQTGLVGRIVQRKKAQAKGRIHGTYEANKWNYRATLTQKTEDAMKKMMKDVFKETEPPYEEESCSKNPKVISYRHVPIPKAIVFAKEMTDFDVWDYSRKRIWSEYYKTAPPKVGVEVPKSIASEKLGAEFVFPQGIPIQYLEDALLKGELPTNLIIGMKEETRKAADGTEKKVKVFSIEPQKRGFGVTLAEKSYRSQSTGKTVKYVTVTSIFPDSPAAKAGLKVGDYFTSLSGKSMADKTKEDVIHEIEQAARHRSRELSMEVARVSADWKTVKVEPLTATLDHPCPGSQILAEDVINFGNELKDQLRRGPGPLMHSEIR